MISVELVSPGDSYHICVLPKEAIRLDSGNLNAYNNRGVAKAKLELYDHAISDYSSAIMLDSEHAPAWKNRAMAHFRIQDFKRACADMKELQELGGDPTPEFAKLMEGAKVSGQC